uniref:Putative secreted protein n=1 Tax=Phlebotomus kandelakii TaxID=1109342 RepID=A0A6B2ECV3_9DIPT
MNRLFFVILFASIVATEPIFPTLLDNLWGSYFSAEDDADTSDQSKEIKNVNVHCHTCNVKINCTNCSVTTITTEDELQANKLGVSQAPPNTIAGPPPSSSIRPAGITFDSSSPETFPSSSTAAISNMQDDAGGDGK